MKCHSDVFDAVEKPSVTSHIILHNPLQYLPTDQEKAQQPNFHITYQQQQPQLGRLAQY